MTLKNSGCWLLFLVVGALVGCGTAHTSDSSDAGSTSDAPLSNDAGLSAGDTELPLADAPISIGPGETCESAQLITEGTYPTETSVGYHHDYDYGNSCSGLGGDDRVYAVDVPAGMRLNATVVGTADFDPSVNLVVDAPGSCVADNVNCTSSDDHGEASDPNTASFANTSAEVKRVLIIVSTFSEPESGPFSLAVSFDAPPSHEGCDDALSIEPGTLTGQSTVGYTNDFGLSPDAVDRACAFPNAGVDRVYAISVPPHQLLDATVTPASGSDYDATLALVPGPADHCAGVNQICAATADDGSAGDAESAAYLNTSDLAAQVFIVVDGAYSSSAGEFMLQTSISTPAAGDVCSTAVVVESGMLAGQSLVGFANNYSDGDGCSAADGADRVYAIDVLSAQHLSVTVQPGSELDISLSVVASLELCDGSTHACADGHDVGSQGDPETVEYTNVSASTQRIYVIVDTYSGSGEFLMTTTTM